MWIGDCYINQGSGILMETWRPLEVGVGGGLVCLC